MNDKEAQLIWEALQTQKVDEGHTRDGGWHPNVQWPDPKQPGGSPISAKDKKARPEKKRRPGQWRKNPHMKRLNKKFPWKEADYVPPQDDLDAQLNVHGDVDADHHHNYMMDQELLQPLHAAAIRAGAKDINDWMIQQIKAQGDNWVQWFIDTVISQENI